ncbi:MAG: EAL domain-containing protein, partial [Betaproteobacteria bacterium]|nr:EAL domain-containing protein [Betaproteobacteria bacterium]
RIEDGPWFAEILREYKRQGFLTAIDDFGAGYAGLRLLADFQPDLIKLDMDLVRHVDQQRPRQAIARAVIRMAEQMGIRLVVEGVESAGERDFFLHEGVSLFQGYLFSRPVFRGLAQAADAI